MSEDDLYSLFPASRRTKEDDLVAPEIFHSFSLANVENDRTLLTTILDWVDKEIDLCRLANIHNFLWIAGRPMPPRPIHQQRLLNREIFITERLDLHLVWTTDRIFLKPLPLPVFNGEQCSCRGRRERALGFLFSYAALMAHESDFHIAKEAHLIPEEVQWSAWRKAVREILSTSPIYPAIDPRFHYGELRLSRLNKIYFYWKTPLSGYASRWNQYGSFFHDNFALLASSTVYIAVVLTAMQVGLATEALQNNTAFQSASYGFTIFSILGPLAATGLVMITFCYLFIEWCLSSVPHRWRLFRAHLPELFWRELTGLMATNMLHTSRPLVMARNWKLLVKPQRGNEAVDRLNDEDLRRCRVCSTGQIRKAFGRLDGVPSVTRGAFFAAGVVAVFVTVYPLAAKVQRRNETSRPDGITIVHDPPSPEFEIVAVHGLGAHPVHTWEGKPSTGSLSKLHLLRDLLREDFPTARISSFAYNSDWLVDAPEKTAQQIGRRLLEKLSQHRGDSQRLPIIFIGHSFGGIVIKEIVDRESARGSSIEPVGIDTDHAGLNKFDSPKHPGYRALKDAVKKLRVKSLLEQADDHIREKHYTSERLKIERLSGDPLSMDQCYINLSIVDHIKTNAKARNRSEDSNSTSQPSPFSLFARQKVEMPIAEIQVRLADVFNERKEPDGNILLPRRVLVRGRAGVGKTTLCKKMVHDFIRNKMWHETFDRVLWVPLRNLKKRAGLGYDLGTLFDHEFFRFSGEHKKSDGTRFARELYKTLTLGRTLFILDGWDEVAGTSKDDDMFAFLYELLSQPNVIITSRPSATLPHGIDVDLELETIGFSPAQVDEYIEKTHGENVDELKAFLRSHQLVRGLVRIPIQLDAFCYCWGDIGSDREKKPETMTTLYQAIQTSLCKKDAARLEKIKAESLTTASRSFIENHVKDELRFLEHLAFAGLAADKIEFNLSDRNRVNEDSSLLLDLDKSLPCLSFLRTSDPSAKSAHQFYHFIHLTFQEYFAARYFVRHWTEKQEKREMQYTLFEKKSTRVVHPIDFLQKHKYDAGYDIMWRFVAGLLDGADEYQSAPFFKEIEKEPADLLGPTHQRLVMHCLSEATSLPDEIRGSRERRLAEWVLFEIDYTGSSTLVRESELPDRVLCDVLSISEKKRVVLEALGSSERVFSHSITTALTQLLEDKDSSVRFHAAEAIGKQSILSDTTVAALMELFKDEDSRIRSSAAEAIGRKSTLSDTTVAALVELFKDEDSSIRSSAAEAIGNQSTLSDTTVAALSILSDTTVAALMELFKDEDNIIRYLAAEVIGNQSTLSDTTVAALMELFKDNDSSIRSSAARAIGNQSTLSDTTVAALMELFKDNDSSVRSSAARAIGNQSTLSDMTVAALVELFKDEDSRIRSSAAEAIGNQS
ncbi:hypothetical protein FAUST_8969, partial [Fusarium austroamericanum]